MHVCTRLQLLCCSRLVLFRFLSPMPKILGRNLVRGGAHSSQLTVFPDAVSLKITHRPHCVSSTEHTVQRSDICLLLFHAKMLNLIKMCVLFRECTSLYLLQSRKWQECAVFLFSATLKTFIANSVQAIDSESAHSWRCKKAAECSACTVWVKQQLGNRWSVCHRAPCPLTQVWKAGKTTETQRRPVLWGLNRNMKG